MRIRKRSTDTINLYFEKGKRMYIALYPSFVVGRCLFDKFDSIKLELNNNRTLWATTTQLNVRLDGYILFQFTTSRECRHNKSAVYLT